MWALEQLLRTQIKYVVLCAYFMRCPHLLEPLDEEVGRRQQQHHGPHDPQDEDDQIPQFQAWSKSNFHFLTFHLRNIFTTNYGTSTSYNGNTLI